MSPTSWVHVYIKEVCILERISNLLHKQELWSRIFPYMNSGFVRKEKSDKLEKQGENWDFPVSGVRDKQFSQFFNFFGISTRPNKFLPTLWLWLNDTIAPQHLWYRNMFFFVPQLILYFMDFFSNFRSLRTKWRTLDVRHQQRYDWPKRSLWSWEGHQKCSNQICNSVQTIDLHRVRFSKGRLKLMPSITTFLRFSTIFFLVHEFSAGWWDKK